jgi:hypothetical protein
MVTRRCRQVEIDLGQRDALVQLTHIGAQCLGNHGGLLEDLFCMKWRKLPFSTAAASRRWPRRGGRRVVVLVEDLHALAR